MKAQHHSQGLSTPQRWSFWFTHVYDYWHCVMLHRGFRLVLQVHDYIVLYCAWLNMWYTFGVRGRLPRMIGTCVSVLDISHLLSWFCNLLPAFSLSLQSSFYLLSCVFWSIHNSHRKNFPLPYVCLPIILQWNYI